MRAHLLLLLCLPALGAWGPPAVPVCERPYVAASAEPRPFSEELQRTFDALVRAELARETHVGLAVGVLHGDARWAKGYGLRDQERGLPATPRTTWRMASITKSFTAVAILQLVEQGRLELDADIRTWVPSFPEKRWPVTVRQLLGHLGGVPHYPRGWVTRDTGPLDTEGAVALVADKALEAEPGTRFIYSTWAYNLLGAAIEAASGQSYEDYLQAHVFGPAGMEHAALDDRRTRDEHHAAGYRLRDGKLVPSRIIDVSGRFAGGGTRASVEDLLDFGQALLEYRLLSPASEGRMQLPMSTRDGRLTDYGMGFATWPLRGHYLVAHAGAQPETSTLLVLLPAEGVTIALASNVEGKAASLKRLAFAFIERLLEDGHGSLGGRPRNPVDRVVHEGLGRIFSYGLAYHQWATRGPGRLPGEGNLPEAFEQVTRMLDRTVVARAPGAALERIRAGHEPRSDWLFIRVGAHMARTLEEALGPERLRSYSSRGPLAFFRDYLAVCESQGCPEPLRFDEALRAELGHFTSSMSQHAP
ncbi:MAG TPA: serine hydrolase domain-containing protein [Myxococcaceae bacterium]|nr:serine hydrolase domain-containing protein [Myxococcaceae bacterium]